jgi:hypothetical protein
MKYTVCLLLCTTCMCLYSNAQQVVPSRGFEHKNSIEVEWVLGGTLNTLNVFVVDERMEAEDELRINSETGFTIKVYPTCTTEFAYVEISQPSTKGYLLEVFDMLGHKVLKPILLLQKSTKVDFSNLRAGMYHLKIYPTESLKPYSSFKVIKL